MAVINLFERKKGGETHSMLERGQTDYYIFTKATTEGLLGFLPCLRPFNVAITIVEKKNFGVCCTINFSSLKAREVMIIARFSLSLSIKRPSHFIIL